MDWLSPIRRIFGFALRLPEPVPIIRAIVRFIFVFFLPVSPGHWCFSNGKQINIVERIALSFGLSITVVTISILSLNMLIDIKITGFNSALIIMIVTIIPVVFYYLNMLMGQH